MATQISFNPSDWMTRFEAAGGAYALTDGHIHLWPSSAMRCGQKADSFAMVVGLSVGNREALVDHLRTTSMVEG